jgi:type IV pilus assembly protein PilX
MNHKNLTLPQAIPSLRQRGFVLIMSLVILLIVTTLGVSLIQTGTLEEKMAAATRNKDIAFQAAEAALLDAEKNIAAATTGLAPTAALASCDSSNGYCGGLPTDGSDRWQQSGWDWSNGKNVDMSKIDPNAQSARYIIEFLKTVGDNNIMMMNVGDATANNPVNYYRITAIGYGANDQAQVILQSTYGK